MTAVTEIAERKILSMTFLVGRFGAFGAAGLAWGRREASTIILDMLCGAVFLFFQAVVALMSLNRWSVMRSKCPQKNKKVLGEKNIAGEIKFVLFKT